LRSSGALKDRREVAELIFLDLDEIRRERSLRRDAFLEVAALVRRWGSDLEGLGSGLAVVDEYRLIASDIEAEVDRRNEG
jgi:hypothetical protein